MRTPIPVVLAVGVAAVLVAGSGCAASTTARPTPSGLAPPITLDQLFVAKYVGRPCDLLRPDRQVQHGLVPPGSAQRSGSGPATCRWTSTLPANPIFTAGVDAGLGLADRYRRRAEIGFFEPTDISSYPAIHTTAEPNGPQLGHCTTEVGVADTALLLVTVDYGHATGVNSADPCADSDTLAFVIMGQLKESGG